MPGAQASLPEKMAPMTAPFDLAAIAQSLTFAEAIALSPNRHPQHVARVPQVINTRFQRGPVCACSANLLFERAKDGTN